MTLIRAMLEGLAVLVPAGRRAWLRAMAAEVEHVDPPERLAWSAGLLHTGLVLAVREGPAAREAALPAAALGLIWWDWHTVESASVVAVLLAGAALLSAWHPEHRMRNGLVLGTCLLAAHAGSEATGIARPFYCWKPLTWPDWLTILAVAPPALAAATLGAWSSRPLSREA